MRKAKEDNRLGLPPFFNGIPRAKFFIDGGQNDLPLAASGRTSRKLEKIFRAKGFGALFEFD